MGIGQDVAQAFTPYRITIHGQRVAVIAATQVIDSDLQTAWTATATQPGLASAYDVSDLVAAVEAARRVSDTVIVFLHWGTELDACPNPDQEPLATLLVGAGADIIVGSHAHVLLGGGYLGSAYVDYGLGNFAFYNDPPPTDQSGSLIITATGRHIDAATWRPAVIQSDLPVPLGRCRCHRGAGELERGPQLHRCDVGTGTIPGHHRHRDIRGTPFGGPTAVGRFELRRPSRRWYAAGFCGFRGRGHDLSCLDHVRRSDRRTRRCCRLRPGCGRDVGGASLPACRDPQAGRGGRRPPASDGAPGRRRPPGGGSGRHRNGAGGRRPRLHRVGPRHRRHRLKTGLPGIRQPGGEGTGGASRRGHRYPAASVGTRPTTPATARRPTGPVSS